MSTDNAGALADDEEDDGDQYSEQSDDAFYGC